ncbi:DUF4347 domain-containing protein [Labrenzia sp. PHM005]|uniref:DUF4347 domain-containing protein n=1 Tax=Labrenzia sp. PHM005 TaxID=2590016 RepID=UPI0011400019|nr:DUF4347 domain-containing protein [Labrenzia sp. PHM005]QDG78756.1 DUF4347 domain-containing protein [Labrenzia sp. PHM005]
MSDNSNVVDFDFVDTRLDSHRDADKYYGELVAATMLGEVEMTSVKQVIDHILKNLKPNQKIGVLRIFDHGDSVAQEFGSDDVSHMDLLDRAGKKSAWRQEFLRLNGRFDKDGYIHLAGCKVGQAKELLMEISKLTGTRVFAGTGLQNAFRVNSNTYVMADAAWSTRRYKYDCDSPSSNARYTGIAFPMNEPVPRLRPTDYYKRKFNFARKQVVLQVRSVFEMLRELD